MKGIVSLGKPMEKENPKMKDLILSDYHSKHFHVAVLKAILRATFDWLEHKTITKIVWEKINFMVIFLKQKPNKQLFWFMIIQARNQWANISKEINMWGLHFNAIAESEVAIIRGVSHGLDDGSWLMENIQFVGWGIGLIKGFVKNESESEC